MTIPDLVHDPIATAVAIVMLNAPKSINALSEAMLEALSAEFDRIADDRSVKVVILRSAGNHFCAGHNLKEMTARREDADGGLPVLSGSVCNLFGDDAAHRQLSLSPSSRGARHRHRRRLPARRLV